MDRPTPGPWEATRLPGKGPGHIVSAGNTILADVHSGGADARVMAAAPEMYEVVRNLVEREVVGGGTALDDSTILECARAALAKADRPVREEE